MTNTDQINEWNGATGTRWVDNQERLDRIMAPFGTAALDAAAIRSGEAVLDIGCGAGGTTLTIARQVMPGGHVTGVDVSAPLLARARERGTGETLPLTFRLEDASTAAFPAAEFDLIFSRFGVMFFDAPVDAFRHMRTALKSSGRLAFICWRTAAENDWARLPTAALRGIVPIPQTDPDAPGPYAFGNRTRLETILRDAGFADIAIRPFDAPLIYGTGKDRDAAIDDALDNMLQIGSLPRLLAGQPDDVRARAITAVRDALAARAGAADVVIDGAAWVVTANND